MIKYYPSNAKIKSMQACGLKLPCELNHPHSGLETLVKSGLLSKEVIDLEARAREEELKRAKDKAEKEAREAKAAKAKAKKEAEEARQAAEKVKELEEKKPKRRKRKQPPKDPE